MFIDARDLLDGVEIASDVCIVGGGPAGITLARELAASGVSVVLLEAGGLERDTAIQRLYAGQITGHPYFPLDAARLRYFGGSSNHWLENGGLRSRPLEPEDFTRRDWIPHSGWPYGRDHLDPYYARAQAICGLGPYEYAPEVWLEESLDWRPVAQDLDTIATAERIIDASLRDAGLGYVEGRYDGAKPLAYTGSWHHMGTTRMNDDPHHGVVDASCRVHGISNLFIAGSSVFPTGGYTTPTLTIVALAIRLAEYLTAELRH